MQNRLHTVKFKKNIKKLNGFIKKESIKKHIDINNRLYIKNSKYDLRFLIKVFLGIFLFFICDYFYALFYKRTDV